MQQAGKQRQPFGLVIAACMAGALAFVWAGLALAWSAAAVQWERTVGETWSGWEMAGVAAALAWAGISAAVLGHAGRRWSDRLFVAVASGMALAVGLGWAWGTRGMPNWPMDSGFFRWFLDRLAEGGYTVETLRRLSGNYDYGAWATRAWPLYYPLRLFTGSDAFGLAVQCVQALLAAACIPLVWRSAKLLCGGKAARWAVAGWIGMPGFGMQAVGLNHQVLGMFGYLAATCLLVEWMFGEGGIRKKTVLAVGMGVLAPVLCFEESVWSLFVLGGWVLLLLECLRPDGHRVAAACALVVMVVVPGRIARTVVSTVLAPAWEANPASINGGSLAFMARGWDFETGGEYSDAMQTVDVLTPREGKDRVFKAYLAGQCAYNGPALVAKLFPSKLAKFLLAGYASMAEEILWANGAERTARIARGMRVGWFVLLYAPLMLYGLWRLARRVEDSRTAWLVLPVALFGTAVMFAGETSPRYAMPIQALLLAAGACGLAGERGQHPGQATLFGNNGFRAPSTLLPHPFAIGTGLVLAGYLAFSAILLASRKHCAALALTDMRTVELGNGHPSESPRTAPFEVAFPDGAGSVQWPDLGGSATACVWGQSWREAGMAEVETHSGEWEQVPLPSRLVLRWTPGEARRVTVRRLSGEGPLHLGYADVQDDPGPDGISSR